MATKKIDFGAIVAAAVVPAGFNLALEGLARKNETIANNYLWIKSGGAAALGAGLVFFGDKKEFLKAAGYGLIGVAGASASSKISTMIASDPGADQGGGDGMNGTKKMMRFMSKKPLYARQQRMALKKGNMPGVMPDRATNVAMPGMPGKTYAHATPVKSMDFGHLISGALFSDPIYSTN